MKDRFVFDANALISAALSRLPTNAHALKKADSIGTIVYSNETCLEFLDVLFRSKFDKYFSLSVREEIADRFLSRFHEVQVTETVVACRDPKDDKYLALALSAQASCIISGDEDLLILHPFQTILILKATDFLQQF
ncbi:putative toxin-antitoxin system toxin component, PIN family [Spirosoma aerolatum]|uniref:putative toxin-antitoxin system toxin component, PIN family n=1 Tax=Spirosoma aerolatum TaxID=1211326 RepID=UPI0009AF15CD|nr:putative toxin-antitoxin system toxin component, PIN family [Spirosoma aerolatum]